MAQLVKKSFDAPDASPAAARDRADVLQVGDAVIVRGRIDPGWNWSEDWKPVFGGDSCQIPHTGFLVAGRLHIVMDDGSEEEYGPGDAYFIPPGHLAWVVGDEQVVSYDFLTAAEFAKIMSRAEFPKQ